MTRALELAIQGKSKPQPNPMVGCVIVLDGEIIGEGYHQQHGGPHAEVEALNNCDQEDLNRASAYVTLEPCSHVGLTPPCANLLIERGIGRVVTAMEDPNPKVSGRGHEVLASKGIEVKSGVLENQAREMNRIFVHLQRSPLPYITLKWAQSADGYMDPDTKPEVKRGSISISSPETSEIVQSLRSHHNAILVGRKTVEVDDPRLTSREENGVDPIKIVLDSECSLDLSDYRFSNEGRCIVVCNSDCSTTEVEYCDGLENGLEHVLLKLRQMGVYSILVEGGEHTLNSFIDAGLWNEAYVLESSDNLEGGLNAPLVDLSGFDKTITETDTIYHCIR